MNKLVPALAIALLAAGMLLLAGCQGASASSGYQTISASEAQAMMDQEDGYVILDVRRADEFASGHIPDAVNVPVESMGGDQVPGLEDKDQLIMIYCRSGNRSGQAAQKMVAMGYANVVDFGGIQSWDGEVVTE